MPCLMHNDSQVVVPSQSKHAPCWRDAPCLFFFFFTLLFLKFLCIAILYDQIIFLLDAFDLSFSLSVLLGFKFWIIFDDISV